PAALPIGRRFRRDDHRGTRAVRDLPAEAGARRRGRVRHREHPNQCQHRAAGGPGGQHRRQRPAGRTTLRRGRPATHFLREPRRRPIALRRIPDATAKPAVRRLGLLPREGDGTLRAGRIAERSAPVSRRTSRGTHMAAQVLRKGQAIVWIPPRAIGERAFATEPVLLAMLPVAVPDKVGGAATPGGLPVTVFGSASTARYVRVSLDALPVLKTATLIFDARDVNLLQAVVPALSGARLQQALPNLVEEALLQDPQSCAFSVGPRVGNEGRRLVATIDRGWLEFVIGAFERRGIVVQAAWPAQLALPVGADRTALACLNDGLVLRTGPLDGLGWGASSDPDSRAEAIVTLLANAGAPSASFAPPAAEPAAAAADEGGAVVGLAARELPAEPPLL